MGRTIFTTLGPLWSSEAFWDWTVMLIFHRVIYWTMDLRWLFDPVLHQSLDDLVNCFIFIQNSAISNFSSAELLNRGLHLQQMRQFMLWTNSNIGAVAEHRTRVVKIVETEDCESLTLCFPTLFMGAVLPFNTIGKFSFPNHACCPRLYFSLKNWVP